MLEHPRLPLELSGLEIVFLADTIQNGDVAQGLPDKDTYVPLARETLLLIGSAYCEVVGFDGIKPGPVTLCITEEMAWLLRSKVHTGDLGMDNKTNVGVDLLLKLYTMLSSFHSGIDPTLEVVAEPDMGDAIVRLHEFVEKEQVDAGDKSSHDTNSNQSTNY